MPTRSRRTEGDAETSFAGDLGGPVTLYDQTGKAFEVFTKTEVTRYRSWGYTEEPPANPDAAAPQEPQMPAS